MHTTKTEQVRQVLIDACYTASSEARGSHWRVRDGIETATNFVEQEPLVDDPQQWVENVLAALVRVRAVLDTPQDEDGFGLGGLATIRHLVEDVRDALAEALGARR